MRICSAIIVCVLLSGCSYQATWQTLNVIDGAQTMHLAASPECFHERAWLTHSLVGKHPTHAEVTGVMALYAVGYYFASEWLEDKAERGGPWPAIQHTFHVTSIGYKAAVIVENHDQGNRPFGEGC